MCTYTPGPCGTACIAPGLGLCAAYYCKVTNTMPGASKPSADTGKSYIVGIFSSVLIMEDGAHGYSPLLTTTIACRTEAYAQLWLGFIFKYENCEAKTPWRRTVSQLITGTEHRKETILISYMFTLRVKNGKPSGLCTPWHL